MLLSLFSNRSSLSLVQKPLALGLLCCAIRHKTFVRKPTKATYVDKDVVCQGRTPQAYGFKDAEEVIAKLINL